jgi:hypothetical protein
MAEESSVNEAEVQEVTEEKSRPRTNDMDFFKVCEEVAKSDNPTVSAISERLGITKASVTQRRNAFNRTYRDHGLVLTPLPRGGGSKKDTDAIAKTLLKMRAEAQALESQEVETSE